MANTFISNKWNGKNIIFYSDLNSYWFVLFCTVTLILL